MAAEREKENREQGTQMGWEREDGMEWDLYTGHGDGDGGPIIAHTVPLRLRPFHPFCPPLHRFPIDLDSNVSTDIHQPNIHAKIQPRGKFKAHTYTHTIHTYTRIYIYRSKTDTTWPNCFCNTKGKRKMAWHFFIHFVVSIE